MLSDPRTRRTAFGVHRERSAVDKILAAGADVLTRAVLHAGACPRTACTAPAANSLYRDLYKLSPPGTG